MSDYLLALDELSNLVGSRLEQFHALHVRRVSGDLGFSVISVQANGKNALRVVSSRKGVLYEGTTSSLGMALKAYNMAYNQAKIDCLSH